MYETDFSEDTTSKQQDDLLYDGDFSQMKRCCNYGFTLKTDVLGISNQVILTVEDPQEKATHREICRNDDMTMTVDKRTENCIDQKLGKEKQLIINLHIPINKGNPSKSNISDISLHHLSKEEFTKGKGISGETLPEISNTDSFDDAFIKNITLHYVRNAWPKEQTPGLTDQLNPKKGEESINKTCHATMTEENICKLEEPVAIGDSSHQENPNFLTKIKSSSDKQKGCQEQSPQKQYTENATLDSGFKHGQGQVHCQFSGFSKVAPKMNFPKHDVSERPLTLDKQTSSSPKLRDKPAILQDMLEALSRSNFVEKQEQKRKTTQLLQQTQMGPMTHIHQEHNAGIEVETSVFKLSSTSQKNPSLSSSYILQKLSRGNQMCQMLREQTDQLKNKVQEFAKSIGQESPYHLQDRRLVLEKLQGHLEFLEQEFLATKEKHLTSQQQVYKHDAPAFSDFDPERQQSMEEKGHRSSNCGRSLIAMQERALHPASVLTKEMEASGGKAAIKINHVKARLDWTISFQGSDMGHSCHSASGPGLQSNTHEDCGMKVPCAGKVCDREPSHAYSKPKCICSWRVNSKSSQDEYPIPGKKNLKAFMAYSSDLAASSPHFHSGRISGGKSLCSVSSTEEMESEILNTSLDHALRTATTLKETTDQMIKTIAEDLAKVKRWRNRLNTRLT
ncbi:protein AKNAD1 isoform X2 [Talpa occidentalis]|uniref:protein AKNAD1 isoform X2 n=1 Tax=Talpa occidentalis TaxID=50954 RepID=UPI00189030D3|nr:protein AKNAD1 isoform X2 [Talpa occidentalis]